jgi:hypothetical protein
LLNEVKLGSVLISDEIVGGRGHSQSLSKLCALLIKQANHIPKGLLTLRLDMIPHLACNALQQLESELLDLQADLYISIESDIFI